jgi:glycosyltransferase involved in cell wall biosynthesis
MSTGKIPASVCILCLNEADRLRRCLAPLADFAEVIVLDSGSTDGSQAICREFGVKLVEGPWLGFAGQRRKAFGLASQKWILWLDADEVVRPELLAELKQLFATGEPPLAAYRINRLVVFEGREVRHGNWFPDYCIRLFRTTVWSMPERAVHESLDINGETGDLAGLLEHHTYRDWDDQRRRAEKYSKLWAQQAAKEGRRPGPLTGPLRGFWRFFRGYVIRRGYLDGTLGFRIAKANGAEVALKYRLLRESLKKAST